MEDRSDKMTTQQVFAKYTELYDISTDIGKNVHYKIHTPTGTSHMRKLSGFYKQFGEYKYLGASIAWVPITTLPVDLLGVGYEAGDTTDPRDLINPILHKGYKGEALITDFLSERALWSENEDMGDSGIQGYSADIDGVMPRMTESGGASKITMAEGDAERFTDWFKSIYYTSLTNSEWTKAHPREGFYKELFPLVRTLAANGQINPVGYPQYNEDKTIDTQYKKTDRNIENINSTQQNLETNSIKGNVDIPNKDSRIDNVTGQITPMRNYTAINQTDIFTHEFERLGWMETSGKGYKLGTVQENEEQAGEYDIHNMNDLDLNRMPKVYMYLVQTPPAYKTKQYYRMSITHRFTFRKFRQVYGMDMGAPWTDFKQPRWRTATLPERGQPLTSETAQRIISGMKMYDEYGTLHDDDFVIPKYEPALENTIEADGDGVTIEKISDGVF